MLLDQMKHQANLEGSLAIEREAHLSELLWLDHAHISHALLYLTMQATILKLFHLFNTELLPHKVIH